MTRYVLDAPTLLYVVDEGVATPRYRHEQAP